MLKECELNKIQNRIHYYFKNENLLQQAFTRKSYSAMNGAADNEVLEFYGDRILDFIVIKEFYNQFGTINTKREFVSSKNVGELCKKDIELVKNANLAEHIASLGFTKYIQVAGQKEKTVPKNKADLFEAILGAVAVDSNWNLDIIENVYQSMMANENEQENCNVIENFIDTFDTLLWRYQICKTENKYSKVENGYECHAVMMIDGGSYEINGFGTTEHFAKADASKYGCKIISLLLSKEFIEGDSYTEQLYFLYKLGKISEPDFRFEYYPANSNYEDLWRCSGTLAGTEIEYQAEDETMIGAKEQVSHAILCEILEIQPEDIEFSDEENFVDEPKIVRGKGLLQLILSMNKKAKIA